MNRVVSAINELRSLSVSGKVLFYAQRDDAAGMRHGNLFVYENGLCSIEFEGLSTDAAIAQLIGMQIVRVVVLRTPGVHAPAARVKGVPADHLVDRLLVAESQVPGSTRARTEDDGMRPGHETPASLQGLVSPITHHPFQFDSVSSAVLEIMEEYFGLAGARKLEGLVSEYPPDSDPSAFLRAAEQLLAGMVGKQKAGDLFASIRQRLEVGSGEAN